MASTHSRDSDPPCPGSGAPRSSFRCGARGWAVPWPTRALPPLCFVREVLDPGVLVIKRRRIQDSGKFVNVALLEGDQIKILDHNTWTLPDSPPLVASLLGFETPTTSGDSISVLIQLAVSMRAHGRGGSLLVVPQGTEVWRESIIGPTPYALLPPYAEARQSDSEGVRGKTAKPLAGSAASGGRRGGRLNRRGRSHGAHRPMRIARVWRQDRPARRLGARRAGGRHRASSKEPWIDSSIPCSWEAPGTCQGRSSDMISAIRWLWLLLRTAVLPCSRGRLEKRRFMLIVWRRCCCSPIRPCVFVASSGRAGG